MRLEGWHIVIIIALAVLLFGAPKLPGLARSVGQSLRIFKSEVKQMKDENTSDDGAEPTVEGRDVNHTPPAGTSAGSPSDLPRDPSGGTGSSVPPHHGNSSTHPQ
ncbi:Sec-independent protein translocase subunit TatA [Arthrobacter sp. Br18]|uniref:Sec-independent protein translocase subunit TatA n=1 Tax=Arthrobacter sp. Br18 TaxID=1312954 RepID=UPI0004BB924B|nr:Sec-independent protein translocase subunit TatA [Arthrobacter sp. Br18]